MRVFVTVGTTTFNTLIRDVDSFAQQHPEHDFVCQIAGGDYVPEHCRWFKFTDDIAREYQQSEVVITHAGAGSVYTLLEMGKTIIVVPNLERADPHQKDLADYVEAEQLALVAYDYESIQLALAKIAQGIQPRAYKKDAFFKTDEIKQYLRIG